MAKVVKRSGAKKRRKVSAAKVGRTVVVVPTGPLRVPRRTPTAVTMTATEAANAFGDVVERAIRDTVITITRHERPQAVVLSYEQYRRLVPEKPSLLPALAEAFDAQYLRLQQPAVQANTFKGFRASPADMGRAALAAARRAPRG